MFGNSPFSAPGNASPMPSAGRGRGRGRNNYNNINNNNNNNNQQNHGAFGNKAKRGGGRGGKPSAFQHSAFSAAFDTPPRTNTTHNNFASGSIQLGFNNGNNGNNSNSSSTSAFGFNNSGDNFGTFNNRNTSGYSDMTTPLTNNDSDDMASNLLANQRKKQTTKADRAARFGTTNKTSTYEEMKQKRIEERRLAIQDGLIPDPNAPTRLEDAIDFRGTCQSMCPEFEMVERDLQNGLDALEMDEYGNVDITKAVKTYRRSAAGNEQPLPGDVRPPDVLIKTLDYLMGSILTQQPLEKCHPFLRDRTRSIRQDFTLQNIRDESAVQAHERIARFHILCLHEMCELDEERFSEQQETEQLRKVLLSLMEFYEDLREDGIEMENEPEFRAYHLISHIRDPDVVRQIQTLPPHLFLHPYVQRALEFYGLMQRNNEIKETSSRRNKPGNVEASQNFYSRFFKLVADPGTPFLMACMLEWHFPDVRKGALKAMNAAYRQTVEVEYICRVLAYDTTEQAIEEAQVYGLTVDTTGDEPLIRFHQKHLGKKKGTIFIEPLSNPKQRQSHLLVEPKKAGLTLQDIVDGLNATANYRPTIPSVPPSQTKRPSFTAPHRTHKSISFAASLATKPAPATNVYQQKQDQERHHQQQIQKQQQQEKQRQLAERVKQRQQEIDIQLKAQQAEIEKREALIRENKQRQRLEVEQKQRELEQQIREAEQAAQAEQERLERERLENEERARQEKERREAELARQRRMVIISQAKKRYMTQLVAAVLEDTTNKTIKEFHRKKCIAKRCANPWLRRARQRIALRHAKADERIQFCNFSECFYPGTQHSNGNNVDTDLYSTATWYSPSPNNTTISLDDMIQNKVALALQLESSALATYSSTEVHPDDLWQVMEYADSIYPLIRTKWDKLRTRMIEDGKQPGWQLWISVADHSLSSSHWFETKFGLDGDFSRRVKYYGDCRITIRSISNQDNMFGKAVDELGAVIFSLSELRHQDHDDLYAIDHWDMEKKRLQEFAASLKHYNPQVRAPFLFTYWPNTKSLEETIMKIPKLLDLASIDVISDFHILVMNPATIKERMDQEIHWLSTNTVINQPLKTNHVITSKIRALTFAVEKTSCNFRIGVTVEEAIHSVNRQIEAYNSTLVGIPLNWKPFVIPSIPEQSMGNRKATSGDFFVLGNAWLDIVAKKGIIKSAGGAEDLGAVVNGTLKQYLYELERRLKRPLLW